jgi:hypothetical protein
MKDDYEGFDETRRLQLSPQVRMANLRILQGYGHFNLAKVTGRIPNAAQETLGTGYFTYMPHLGGKTPVEMRKALGLRDADLVTGADIYQLTRVPTLEEFEPRGYTGLVDGARLKAGLRTNSDGYRGGQSLPQWSFTKPPRVTIKLIATLLPGQRFDLPMHPNTRK